MQGEGHVQGINQVQEIGEPPMKGRLNWDLERGRPAKSAGTRQETGKPGVRIGAKREKSPECRYKRVKIKIRFRNQASEPPVCDLGRV